MVGMHCQVGMPAIGCSRDGTDKDGPNDTDGTDGPNDKDGKDDKDGTVVDDAA